MKAVIADGNRKDQFELRRILESVKIHVIEACSNGRELLTWLESNPRKADLVFMEVMLPVIDGYAAFCEMRESKLATPVIFITNETSEEVKKSLLQMGAKGYITKPLSREKLLAGLGTSPKDS